MIIRNKFNGYGFDGTRLCHDPVSLSLAAVKAGAASSAAAAGTAAATTAATAAGTAAAQTAALEAAKQAAIQQGMQQVGVQAGKTAALEASKKGIIDASMQQMAQQAGQQGIAQAGTQAAQQSAVEAAKQGIFSAKPAGIPPTAGGPITPPSVPAQPLPPAGGAPNTMSANLSDKGIMTDAGVQGPGVEILPQKAPTMSLEEAQALNNQLSNASANNPYLNTRVELNPAQFDSSTLANTAGPESSLTKGAREAIEWVGDNKINTGLGLMSVGQYMNQPKGEEEDKDKYKSTVDMSDFRPSIPEQPSFTRSYEYQRYQSGGPVEDMSRMNSLGANTGFPMARLQTPAYAVSSATPMPVNTLTPSADASVNAYTGEPRFAEGGISAAERREYGLRTKGERAARNLTTSYEEMEAERQKEAMKLFGERTDPGIVPRSRTQMLSSPFSAAMAEHARLGKKSKVPVVEMPKTNLGDIDNYMDIPIEAASGGIMHGLGGYSDGGRLLRGPGDGVSDSIPAVIGKRQPARLADGEFVIPARIVSELGNGSTEAGARKLYAMMERVQRTRKKSIGKKKVAVNSKADKHLPA
jgi:hypothetical protein